MEKSAEWLIFFMCLTNIMNEWDITGGIYERIIGNTRFE